MGEKEWDTSTDGWDGSWQGHIPLLLGYDPKHVTIEEYHCSGLLVNLFGTETDGSE